MNKLDKLREYRTFLTRAARHPSTIGAVLPTSSYVAEAIVNVLPSTGSPTVLELGPGTGALSDAIHHRLDSQARHIAVELDPEMVRYLRKAKPWLHILEGDARDLNKLLETVGITRVDAVISSIPWTLLDQEQQRTLLREAGKAMAPHGVFTAITYVTTLWRANTRAFTRALHDQFGEVLPRSAVWRNLPPARIYVCRRPVPNPS